MIIPIAIKYNQMGILEFVRCMYFDVDTTLCPEIYAISANANSNRKHFQNCIIMDERINLSDNFLSLDSTPFPEKIGFSVQTAPVTPDSQYALATNLPARAIDMTNAHIINIPAQEYISKYGNILRTRNIAILDYAGNAVEQAVQVIAPKVAIYKLSNMGLANGQWCLVQNSYLIPDDFCLSYSSYKKICSKVLTAQVTKNLPLDIEDSSKHLCTVYVIDYKGNIYKTSLEKARKLDVTLANITKTGRMYQGFCEGCSQIAIPMLNMAYGNSDKTEELQIQGTLQGIPNPEQHYEAVIPPQATNVMTPSLARLMADVPNDYAIQNIRFGDIIKDLEFKCYPPLDMLILPKVTNTCVLRLRTVKQVQMPEYCYDAVSVEIAKYLGKIFELNLQGTTANAWVGEAPNLEYINFNIYKFVISGRDYSFSQPRFMIPDAPALKQITITQPEPVESYFRRIEFDIKNAKDYAVIVDCNITKIMLSSDTPKQVITVHLKRSLYTLEIISELNLCNKIIVIPENKSIKIFKIVVKIAQADIIYLMERDERGNYIVQKAELGAPEIEITGQQIMKRSYQEHK